MGKCAFIFTGQGAQYVGMGKHIYDNFIETRDIFDKADEILGFSIKKLCFEGPKESLNDTVNTQPAILTVSMAMYEVMRRLDYKPSVLAGLSLGEYSALTAGGVLSFENSLKIVSKRGKFMREAVKIGVGTMSAVIGKLDFDIEKVLQKAREKGEVSIANYNCPGQIVITGKCKAVDYAGKLLLAEGAKKIIPLSVSGPFHCNLLKSASDNLSKELDKYNFNKINTPIISNVTAKYFTDEKIKELLTLQVISPVFWQKTIENMINKGVDTFVEIGPGKVLSGFVKKINRSVKTYNAQNLLSVKN